MAGPAGQADMELVQVALARLRALALAWQGLLWVGDVDVSNVDVQ